MSARQRACSHTSGLRESLQGATFVVFRRWRGDSAPRRYANATAAETAAAATSAWGRAAGRPPHADGAPPRRGGRGGSAPDLDRAAHQRLSEKSEAAVAEGLQQTRQRTGAGIRREGLAPAAHGPVRRRRQVGA